MSRALGIGDQGSGVEAGKITALVPYFGGKRGMAEDIVREVCWDPTRGRSGTPSYFAEPFCGSMAVSLSMPDVPTHLVNDLHEDLINFARVMASFDADELFRRCERTLCSEELYEEAAAKLEFLALQREVNLMIPDKVEWAWAFFVTSWLGPNGMAGTEHAPRFCVRWGPGGGDPAKRLASAIESLPWMMSRLRRFTITERDAFDVLESLHDVPGMAIYCDPPYTLETRKAGAYRHDFEDHAGATLLGGHDDHDRLAASLARFRHARVVVSYEDCPRVRALYQGWTVIEKTQHKNTGNASGGSATAPEILLVNGAASTKQGGS